MTTVACRHTVAKRPRQGYPSAYAVLPKLCTVWKDGMNQGRLFWGAQSVCSGALQGMFRWADDAPPTAKDEAHVWRRFPPTRIVHHNQEGLPMFKPDDVMQGRVGDCWFLLRLHCLPSDGIYSAASCPIRHRPCVTRVRASAAVH